MTGPFAINEISISQLEDLKYILRKYQYTQSQLLQIGINPFSYDQYDLPLVAYHYNISSSFGILFHLFFLGMEVKLDNIKKIFYKHEIDNLLKINIFEKVNSTSLQSCVQILPYKNYYFACDFILNLNDQKYRRQRNIELVYPVRLDSITLSEVSIKKPVNSILDLGCGSGFISIIASKHSKKVVGIDINPRAVNFSIFNSILNNISNCRFICGDLYTPIKREKYDLILSNPPYEIVIKKTNLFQDGGDDGHKILKRIIQNAPPHLTNNGFCQVITKISEFHNASKEQTFKKWLKGKNIHILFLLLYKMSINQSAYSICTDLFTYKDERIGYKIFSENIKKILQHFTKIHFSNISFGIITLTKTVNFKYVEHSFDSSHVLATELSVKLQYNIYKHFVKQLGLFSVLYFLKFLLCKIQRKFFRLLISN